MHKSVTPGLTQWANLSERAADEYQLWMGGGIRAARRERRQGGGHCSSSVDSSNIEEIGWDVRVGPSKA